MGDIKMSARGRKRLEMLSLVKKDALITQAKASELLGIGYRHTRRVCERYGEEGDGGPIRGNRGRASSRRIEEKPSEDDYQGEAIPPLPSGRAREAWRATPCLRRGGAGRESRQVYNSSRNGSAG